MAGGAQNYDGWMKLVCDRSRDPAAVEPTRNSGKIHRRNRLLVHGLGIHDNESTGVRGGVVYVGHQIAVVFTLGIGCRRENGFAARGPLPELDVGALAGLSVVLEDGARRACRIVVVTRHAHHVTVAVPQAHHVVGYPRELRRAIVDLLFVDLTAGRIDGDRHSSGDGKSNVDSRHMWLKRATSRTIFSPSS